VARRVAAKLLHILAGVASLTATASAAPLATGHFAGDGTSSRSIEVGFAPDVVFVRSSGNEATMLATSTMANGDSKLVGASTGFVGGGIVGLTSSGFTVGNKPEVNGSSYTVFWAAFAAAPGEMAVGSYLGDGQPRSIAGVGFMPDYLIVVPEDSQEVCQHSSASSETGTVFSQASGSDFVESLTADGFALTNSSPVNRSGRPYHWAAWRAIPGQMAVGSYTGDGTPTREVAGLGFSPEYVFVRGPNLEAVQRMRPMDAVATAYPFSALQPAPNSITGLGPDGFALGSDSRANGLGVTYFWQAWGVGSSTADAGLVTRPDAALVGPDAAVEAPDAALEAPDATAEAADALVPMEDAGVGADGALGSADGSTFVGDANQLDLGGDPGEPKRYTMEVGCQCSHLESSPWPLLALLALGWPRRRR